MPGYYLVDGDTVRIETMRQCIGQRNPVPFLRRHPREKHMLSETLDARAFKVLGVGDVPYSPGSRLEGQNEEDYDR